MTRPVTKQSIEEMTPAATPADPDTSAPQAAVVRLLERVGIDCLPAASQPEIPFDYGTIRKCEYSADVEDDTINAAKIQVAHSWRLASKGRSPG